MPRAEDEGRHLEGDPSRLPCRAPSVYTTRDLVDRIRASLTSIRWAPRYSRRRRRAISCRWQREAISCRSFLCQCAPAPRGSRKEHLASSHPHCRPLRQLCWMTRAAPIASTATEQTRPTDETPRSASISCDAASMFSSESDRERRSSGIRVWRRVPRPDSTSSQLLLRPPAGGRRLSALNPASVRPRLPRSLGGQVLYYLLHLLYCLWSNFYLLHLLYCPVWSNFLSSCISSKHHCGVLPFFCLPEDKKVLTFPKGKCHRG